MNSSRNNRRKQPKNQQQLSEMQKQTHTLELIRNAHRLEMRGILPTVPDVEPLTLKRDKVYTIEKAFSATSMVSNATVETDWNYTFNLNIIGDSAALIALFDQWRIVQVTVSIIPTFSLGFNNTNSSTVYSVIDYDDAALTSASALLDYDTLMITQAGQPFSRTFRPRAAVAAYSGAFTSFGSAPDNMWFDVASPSVNYYGLKLAIGATPAGIETYNVVSKIVYQFRNGR